MSCRKQTIADVLLIALSLGGLFFFLLGSRPLWVPDEGRYAEIAREMIANHDYITPYLNSIKYFEKPILFYWLEVLSIKAFGMNLWSLRSINALLALFGCLFTYYTGRTLYNRATGLTAAFILATSSLYFVMAHFINLDLTVSVFLAVSLFAFLIFTQTSKQRWLLVMYAFAALATLTKGLIGIVFPAMIIGTWMLVYGQWAFLRPMFSVSGIGLFLLLTAPWHILVSLKHPDFAHFYFIEQHFLRYTSKAVGHYQPNWFFIPVLFVGLFPWIAFFPNSVWQPIKKFFFSRKETRNEGFLLLWIGLVFLFFSFSKSKLIPYILPIFPPAALLIANQVTILFANQQLKQLKLTYFALILCSLMLFIFSLNFTRLLPLPSGNIASFYFMLATIVLLLGLIIGYSLIKLKPNYVIPTTLITLFLFFTACLPTIPLLDQRSVFPLALTLNKVAQAEDEVISVNRYYQDLPFYTKRRITVVNWRNELQHGMNHQNTEDWMIDETILHQRWQSNKRVFVMLGKKDFAHYKKTLLPGSHLVGETSTTVLISNHH